MRKYRLLFILPLLLLAGAVSFYFFAPPSEKLKQGIPKKEKLRVIMTNNANVYYSYRGQEMGFE